MRRKNTKFKKSTVNKTQSTSISFYTGTLLGHPSGHNVFKEQSVLIQKQKQRVNDIFMLNRSPNFQKGNESESDISSEIENPESQIKLYKPVKKYKVENSRLIEYDGFVELERNESSQISDEKDKKRESFAMLNKDRKRTLFQSWKKVQCEEEKQKFNEPGERKSSRMMTEYEQEKQGKMEIQREKPKLIETIKRKRMLTQFERDVLSNQDDYWK